ncbi:MAG: HypC/HybG/HupF family hydrogenase formation chaperone [Nitrososphaerota archaeon]
MRIDLIENVKPGDYIILHAGFAIQKIDEKEALETLKILEEVLKRNE